MGVQCRNVAGVIHKCWLLQERPASQTERDSNLTNSAKASFLIAAILLFSGCSAPSESPVVEQTMEAPNPISPKTSLPYDLGVEPNPVTDDVDT